MISSSKALPCAAIALALSVVLSGCTTTNAAAPQSAQTKAGVVSSASKPCDCDKKSKSKERRAHTEGKEHTHHTNKEVQQ